MRQLSAHRQQLSRCRAFHVEGVVDPAFPSCCFRRSEAFQFTIHSCRSSVVLNVYNVGWWFGTPHPSFYWLWSVSNTDPFAVAGVDPGGSFSDLHCRLGGEEHLEWTLPPVGSPVLSTQVFDQDVVTWLEIVEWTCGWHRQGG